MSNNAALAAATWWANKLCSPSFDNGDSGIASMLALMNASLTPTPTNDQIQKMIDALAPKIDANLSRTGYYGATLGVDYGPDPTLADAAKEANISSSKFPWKTIMWIYEDRVVVSLGYHGRSTLVWASEEWLANRPICENQKWDKNKARKDENYHGEPLQCGLPKYHTEECDYNLPLALCKTCGRYEGHFYHDTLEKMYLTEPSVYHDFVE